MSSGAEIDQTPATTRTSRVARVAASLVDPTRTWRDWLTSWRVTILAAALGAVVIGLSYRISGEGGSAQLYYVVFWVGMLVGIVPIAVRLVGPATGWLERSLSLGLLALFTAIPKYLRNPAGPLYHDEYAHWREATDVVTGGRLMPPNAIIPIVEFYPGTSALTAAISFITGLRIWESGLLLVLSAHVLTLFAIAVLAQVHLRSHRSAAVAALVYALNPSVLYFDTQYAYESVTIAWFLWVLAFASLAAREPRRRVRRALVGGALLCAAATIVTHHLTSLALIGVVLLVSMVVALRPRVLAWADARRERRSGDGPSYHDRATRDKDEARLATRTAASAARRRSSGLAGATAMDAVPPALMTHPRAWYATTTGLLLMATTWIALVAYPTIAYLSPYAGSSVQQLSNLAAGDKSSGRTLLAASVQPLWERGFAALAPLVVAAFSLWGLWLVWRRIRLWSPDTIALVLFGMVYFPSVAFILAPSGAEGARRSWAFTWAGVALLVALAVAHPPKVPRFAAGWPTRAWTWAAAASLVVVLIGNVAAGLNDPYRFPGKFTWGSDTNSASDEARTVAEQLDITVGQVRAVSDRYTALALSAYGGVYVATPSTGFPAANLVQTDQDPMPDLVRQLRESVFDYVVVDTRMAQAPAFNGDNFGSADPLPGRATPQAFLDRLDTVPWASRVMSTTHLRVYRLDLSRIGQTVKTS